MKLTISCFGLGCDQFVFHDPAGRYSFAGRDDRFGDYNPSNYFIRMPAVSMQTFGSTFVPDYPALILFDEFIIDQETYDSLKRKEAYREMFELLKAFQADGRLEIISFEERIEPCREIIKASAEYDFQNLELWVDAFEELVVRWLNFTRIGREFLNAKAKSNELTPEEEQILWAFDYCMFGMIPTPDGLDILNALKNWRDCQDARIRERTKEIIMVYFNYLASNLCLGQMTGSSIHEWNDIEPLYKQKLKFSARTDGKEAEEVAGIRQLFKLMFPEFKPKSAKHLVQIFSDKRVENIRKLVRNSVQKNEYFDEEYAVNALHEIFAIEKKTQHYRKVIGWATSPVGFVPVLGSALQLVLQESADALMTKKIQQGKDWFFLISEITAN